MTQQTKNSKGLAIASMVCGLVSIVFVWNIFFWFFHLIEAIVGIVLGIISLSQKKDGKGMAIAGISTSGAFLLISLFLLTLGAFASTNYSY